MDWISGIQRALDYTEAHLTEEIDFEMAARQAYASSFHFQRVFSTLCGFSLGEYIRMRRLTLAAEDLICTKDKVIDVALKYGYDTPESFSRAFSRFHGVTPTQARRGGTVKSFSRLHVKLILSGGSTLDYRIEKKGAFQLVCKQRRVIRSEGGSAAEEIAAFWRACTEDGTIQAVCRRGRFDRLHGVLGVCFSGEMANAGFPYGIGAEYNGTPLENEGLKVVEIPAHTYAVFTCTGKMPQAFIDTYKQICTEFFPQSNYEYGNGIELEIYPSDKVDNPCYQCEIWIAVNEKK